MRTGDRRWAAALCGVLVVACSNNPKAGTLPTPTVTTVAPTSASPTASANYEAEVRAAIDAYFVSLYEAGLDPARKTDALAALLSESCACRDVVRVLREEARLGRYIDYTYKVADLRVIDAGPLGANVTYTVQQSAGAERERSGRVIQTFAPSTTRYAVRLVRDGGLWLLDRVEERT